MWVAAVCYLGDVVCGQVARGVGFAFPSGAPVAMLLAVLSYSLCSAGPVGFPGDFGGGGGALVPFALSLMLRASGGVL